MQRGRSFIRTPENFRCESCGEEVSGDGYTNHCPQCLWSRHVDVNPGDRASECGAMMKPIGIRRRNGQIQIVHECVECRHRRPNRLSENDNEETVRMLSSVPFRE